MKELLRLLPFITAMTGAIVSISALSFKAGGFYNTTQRDSAEVKTLKVDVQRIKSDVQKTKIDVANILMRVKHMPVEVGWSLKLDTGKKRN